VGAVEAENFLKWGHIESRRHGGCKKCPLRAEFFFVFTFPL